jgi:23S rRNA pseudouridine2604 synthase
MTFRKRLQYFLVKKLKISNQEALRLIQAGKISVDKLTVNTNIELGIEEEICLEGEVLRAGKQLVYYAFYKPPGIETTFNTAIEDNLKSILPFKEATFAVGRLDKASEGLLLITNDGSLYDEVLRHENKTEKEYELVVSQEITDDFILKMASGIVIMGKQTLPCQVQKINEKTFRIVLTQGLNRQIRRMCFKLGYNVERLTRTRIGDIHLGNLLPSDWVALKKSDYSVLGTKKQ